VVDPLLKKAHASDFRISNQEEGVSHSWVSPIHFLFGQQRHFQVNISERVAQRRNKKFTYQPENP
jgi:hypothetical protein